MAINNDISKLKRENELLRQELARLKSAGQSQTSVKTHARLEESRLVFNFKHIKGDLLRTTVATCACLTIIIGLYLLESKIPGLTGAISRLNF